MKQTRVLSISLLALILAAMAMSVSACKPKVTPPPAVVPAPSPVAPKPEPPKPSPTITLSASPSTIEKGQTSTLRWNSTNSTSVSIDGGVGTVEASGSRSVHPETSTTFRARASGPGGSATAEARITVTEPPVVTPPPARPLSDTEFFNTYIKDIFFDYDKYDIREDARTTLTSTARVLADRPGIRFTIEGHCDERGSEKYNVALGDRRADAAKRFLVTQGVTADRIDIVSYGKERPVCTQQNEDCWQKNRRAHFLLR